MFDKVKAFFTGLNAALSAFFNSKGGQVVKQALAGLLTELGPIAVDLLVALADAAVLQAEQQAGVSGTAKKSAAVNAIVGSMNAAGHQVLTRQANLAIELAVQKLNAPPA